MRDPFAGLQSSVSAYGEFRLSDRATRVSSGTHRSTKMFDWQLRPRPMEIKGGAAPPPPGGRRAADDNGKSNCDPLSFISYAQAAHLHCGFRSSVFSATCRKTS